MKILPNEQITYRRSKQVLITYRFARTLASNQIVWPITFTQCVSTINYVIMERRMENSPHRARELTPVHRTKDTSPLIRIESKLNASHWNWNV